jgi:malonyl-CoA O-methyltransferase
MELEQRAVSALLPPLTGALVLDLAGGTGRYGLLAQEQGATRVTSLDNSLDMLERNPLTGRVCATTEALPLADASIDVIVCGLALGHLPELSASISEIGRVLRPQGVVLISDVHPFVSLNGAERTFTGTDGHAYAVEHHVHLYEDYARAAAAAGLRIDAVSEPRYGQSPVVIVYRMVKL